jgi:DNA-binding Xre family transcriptional regulator
MPRRSGYTVGNTEQGTMYITLKAYLDHLEAIENSKAVHMRRTVPSMEELARVVGIHPVTLSKIANSNIRQLNLETGGRIITAMRRFGFPMTITDLIAYRPPDDMEASGDG